MNMLPWFLREPDRLRKEREAIEELLRSAEWLIGAEWGLDSGLYLDAVIRAHGHDYELRVEFPPFFPDAPAIVLPRNMQSRLSQHQYGGADGPLCLQWGPDNWHRDVTAVLMLESAHQLLEIENPLGQERPEQPVIAPSRHQLTIGQELRGEWSRWYFSEKLREFLKEQPKASVGSFRFTFRNLGQSWASLVHEAMPLGGAVWKDVTIPSVIPEAGPSDLYTGVWFKTDLGLADIGKPGKIQDLRQILAPWGASQILATDGTSPVEGFQRSIAGVLIIDRMENPHLFIVLSNENLTSCVPVRSEETSTSARMPDIENLADKRIGIVGLGSAGSKIALSLARMGAKNYYLVDHDLLLPENLQRHALNWQGVTQHKVDAMATAIRQIAAEVKVDVARSHLTGQESNATISGVMKRLCETDVIIDATANSEVFNLLSAVARTATKPMVWLEIYGGGIGGVIARSRPGMDPSPQDMRRAYLQYCSENPDQSPHESAEDYAAEGADGEVLVASDADVAIISHHAARLVSDCFLPAERSRYPYSMYLIGLSKAWVFDAPFATIPISMETLPVAHPVVADSAKLASEEAAFLLDIMKKAENESTSAT